MYTEGVDLGWNARARGTFAVVQQRGTCSPQQWTLDSFYGEDLDQHGTPTTRARFGMCSIGYKPTLRGDGRSTRSAVKTWTTMNRSLHELGTDLLSIAMDARLVAL